MDELKGIFKNYKPSQKYSEAFKRAVVKEFEEGSFSKDFIQDKYGLGGNSVLLNWCRKYGKFAYPKNNTIVVQFCFFEKLVKYIYAQFQLLYYPLILFDLPQIYF